MEFRLVSNFKPTGDQPQAIKELIKGVKDGDLSQVLQGVTGSGKTFTIANVIQEIQKPTLILSHNKTLAAQLYGEFKAFFPDNAVEYFVSYYDYYQPEAYLPTTNVYIEKDLSINDEIEKLRLRASSSLMSGRKDVIVISSVSCIYGIGNPSDFHNNIILLEKGKDLNRNEFLLQLVDNLYNRTEINIERGSFRVKGDSIEVFPVYSDEAYRIIFWDNEIESIESFNPIDGYVIEEFEALKLYPANIFITNKDKIKGAVVEIQNDMSEQVDYFKSIGKHLEAKRLLDRVTYDIEMMKELGYCSGIENYSRYFDGRSEGDRPFCLMDYFGDDSLLVIDESHVSIPQIGAMYGGDRSRKNNLVEYGFRLPSALDNRPLKFTEFESLARQTIYVSATPANYELERTEGVVVEQLIRPTGLLDPIIELRPSHNQIDNLLEEIEKRNTLDERTLVTTLTKRMAEELSEYMDNIGIRCRYIHSDVATLERVEIMRDLRIGLFDVLIGVNLLREGLDLPEVSLVAILDADKEGFLRSERSLTQTAGRAARNINSLVIFYADKITKSMQKTIDETNRKRKTQKEYNILHNITPTAIIKKKTDIMNQTSVANILSETRDLILSEPSASTFDPITAKMTNIEVEKRIKKLKKDMKAAAKKMEFIEAAKIRDEIYKLEEKLNNK